MRVMSLGAMCAVLGVLLLFSLNKVYRVAYLYVLVFVCVVGIVHVHALSSLLMYPRLTQAVREQLELTAQLRESNRSLRHELEVNEAALATARAQAEEATSALGPARVGFPSPHMHHTLMLLIVAA